MNLTIQNKTCPFIKEGADSYVPSIFLNCNIMERNEKYNDFEMDASKIGRYIVMKSRLLEKFYALGICISSISNEEAYGVFRIDWYDKKVFPENTYKAKLVPCGKLKEILSECSWYCSDIVTLLQWNQAEYFEDPFDALQYANVKNAELYPEYSEYFGISKKLNRFQHFVKKLFKI